MQRIFKEVYKLLNTPHKVRSFNTKLLFEPEYLESMKSKIPLHNDLNIQLKGYDYAVLESYQKYLHKLLKCIEINIEDSWGTPAINHQILKYKPKSSVVDAEYKLNLYERNIQMTDVTSTQYPVILQILEASLPEGVQLSVHPHDEHYDEIRYVPDRDLLQLKSQLEEMAPSTSSKKK